MALRRVGSARIPRTSKGFRVAAFRSEQTSQEDPESSDMEEAASWGTDAGDAQAEEDICWMLRTYAFPGVTVHVCEHSAVVMVPVLDQSYSRYKWRDLEEAMGYLGAEASEKLRGMRDAAHLFPEGSELLHDYEHHKGRGPAGCI